MQERISNIFNDLNQRIRGSQSALQNSANGNWRQAQNPLTGQVMLSPLPGPSQMAQPNQRERFLSFESMTFDFRGPND